MLDGTTANAAIVTSGIGGVLLGLRWLLKMYRSDVNDFRHDGDHNDLITHYRDLSESYRIKAEESAKRADTFAAERNVAVQLIGELRGTVEAQTVVISTLEKDVVLLSASVDALTTKLESAIRDKNIGE